MIIKLADGRPFDTVKKEIVENETPDADDVSGELPVPSPKSGVRLEDLPANTKTMNVVCAVAGYKLLGLSDGDICLALGCTHQQLLNITEGDIYDKCMQDIIAAFVRGQEKTARDILARNAMSAAHTLVTIASKSKNEQNKLKAAESILNRNNITGDDNHGMSGPGLTIKIIKDHKHDEISISL